MEKNGIIKVWRGLGELLAQPVELHIFEISLKMKWTQLYVKFTWPIYI